MIVIKPLLFLLSIATILLLGPACTGGKASPASGFLVQGRQDLLPTKLSYEDCVLVFAGDRWPAKVSEKHDGDEYQIDLLAHDQVIESERYQSTDEAFSLVSAVGEKFTPPIPLVKYGMRVGEGWNWTGTTETGPAKHKATAKVTTTSESLPIKGQTVANVIRVDVALALDSGIPEAPAPRKISFWIAPKMGVVKRSYENYSVREPPEK